ncbi:MMPL family transporter, partial [Streptomyces sp. MCAF7]
MAAWARWCLRHRLVVLLLWVGALFGTAVASGVAGSAYANVFGFPGTESSRAMERMEKAFPQRAGDTDSVVWEVDRGKSVKDPAVRERMSAALADIGKLPEVGTVVSPYEPEGARQISENGRIAYAEVTFTKQAFELRKENIQKVVDRAEEARTGGLRVELGGQA